LLLEELAHAQLVGRVRVRVDEADRDRLDATLPQDRRHAPRVVLVERLDHLAGVVDPLGHLEAVAPADVRRRDVLVGVPEVVLRAPADLDHVAEVPRRDHRRRRQVARDQRVRRDGRAVREEDDVAEVDPGLGDAGHDRVDRIGARRHLPHLDLAAVLVEDADVRERAADVDGHAQVPHARSLMACRLGGIGTRTDTSLWHPFSDMAAVRGHELVIERGEGVWLWDEDGNRYLDGSASLWYANVGHGRAEIADAVAAQIRKLEAWSIFGDAATPPAVELADRLSRLSSLDGAKVFFTTGGGDAVDTAAKFARLYWQVLGQPERLHIVSRTRAYHGTMAFGTSIGGIEANRIGYGPLVPSTSQVQWDSPDALRDEIERIGAERIAAFFAEPVIGAGGVFPPPPGYVEAVARICRDAGILFVCD